MVLRKVKCSECGEILLDYKGVCPKCDLHKKHYFITLEEKLPEVHDQIRAKLKGKGVKKTLKEIITGYEKFKT